MFPLAPGFSVSWMSTSCYSRNSAFINFCTKIKEKMASIKLGEIACEVFSNGNIGDLPASWRSPQIQEEENNGWREHRAAISNVKM